MVVLFPHTAQVDSGWWLKKDAPSLGNPDYSIWTATPAVSSPHRPNGRSGHVQAGEFMSRYQTFARVLVAGVVGLSLGLPIVTAPAAQAATTWVVDDRTSDNDSPCPAAQFSKISAAVAAAQPGDTIQVCEGTYRETVAIDKPGLTLVGPHTVGLLVKHDAQILSASGGFIIGANADNTTIKGILVRKAGSDGTETAAVESTAGAIGVTLSGNGFRDNAIGVRMTNLSPFSSAAINGNDFKQNLGTDVVIPGAAHNLSIRGNRFWNNGQLGIDFQGDSTEPSVNVSISGNNVRNERFVEIANTENAIISDQKNKTVTQGPVTGSAILDRGNNLGLNISANRISAENGIGITLSAAAGSPSVNTEIRRVDIYSSINGIVITGDNSSAWVTRSSVNATNVGISIDSGRGNQITYNQVDGEVLACQDLTVGTDGRPLNQWLNNTSYSQLSYPELLCPHV